MDNILVFLEIFLMTTSIETFNLTKRYPSQSKESRSALDNYDLHVEAGQLYGIVGPDGAGKTTLLRILSTVLTPTSGYAQIDGFDVIKQSEQVRSRIGYMPQAFSLYPDLSVLENLRFYDAEEHPEKDPTFAKRLAALGDVYINDAFGTAHRAHSSTAVIAQYFPKKCAAGLLMMKEVNALGSALLNPKRPFVALVGGAKISTKIGVLTALLQKADTLIVGGAMSFTFMKAMGLSTGTSPIEETMLDKARQTIDLAKTLGKQLVLPVDLVIAAAFENTAPSKTIAFRDGIPDGFQGMDIGPKTVSAWKPILEGAKTIFWNGPVGVFEMPSFAKGTQAIAQIVAGCTQAFTVVGGGDSVAALEQAGLQSAISHVSTGGGASLEFIEQGTLPGLEALSSK